MDTAPDSSAPPPEAGGPTLDDRWGARPLYLDGPLERTHLQSPTLSFVMGILGLGAAFILFQVLITPILLFTQIGLAEGGLSSLSTMEPSTLMASYTRELIISNSVGQLLGLAVPALLLTRFHTRQVTDYIRLRGVDGRLLLLAVVGVIVLQPVVQWMAQINSDLPLPETIRMLEQSQMEMIQSVLESGLGVSFNLVTLALVPAVCEELLFRGYAQRQFERSTGAAGGIALSGLLFGAYHLRPSQFLPLAALGLYLAYLTWRTGSLWPAVLVHLVHNGLAVLIARYAQDHPSYELETIEQAPMPWYAILGGFAIFGGVLYVLDPLARRLRDTAS